MAVYGHGIGGGDDECDAWLSTIASLGTIVIAPYTSGGACLQEYKDMYGNFDTIPDQISRSSQFSAPRRARAPCDMLYFMPTLLGCCLVL